MCRSLRSWIFLTPPSPGRLPLGVAAALIQLVAVQSDHMEEAYRLRRVGWGLSGGSLEVREPSIATTCLRTLTPGLRLVLSHCLKTCFDLPEAMSRRRDGPVLVRAGYGVDGGRVPIARADVPPNMLVHADDFHALQAAGILDQAGLGALQDGVVRSVPDTSTLPPNGRRT